MRPVVIVAAGLCLLVAAVMILRRQPAAVDEEARPRPADGVPPGAAGGRAVGGGLERGAGGGAARSGQAALPAPAREFESLPERREADARGGGAGGSRPPAGEGRAGETGAGAESGGTAAASGIAAEEGANAAPGSGPAGDDAGSGAPEAAADADTAGDPVPPGILFSSTEEEQYDTTHPVDVPGVEDFSRDAGAVTFWLEPGWAEGSQDDADFIDLGDGGLRVVKNVNYLRFEFTDALGNPGGVGVDISAWEIGAAHQVTATWDGSRISLFVDGKLVSQRPNPGLQRAEERGPVVLGSVYPADRPIAPGMMTGVKLFGRPLDPQEIASLYQTEGKR